MEIKRKTKFIFLCCGSLQWQFVLKQLYHSLVNYMLDDNDDDDDDDDVCCYVSGSGNKKYKRNVHSKKW